MLLEMTTNASTLLSEQNLPTNGYESGIYIATISFYLTFCGLYAVLGSTLCLLILNQIATASESQALLLKMLKVTDVFTGIFSILQQFSMTFCGSEFLCKFVTFFIFMCSSSSRQIVMFIAIDKLFSVLRPLTHPSILTNFRLKVAFLICLSPLTVLVIFTFSADSLLDQIEYIPQVKLCWPQLTNIRQKLLVMIIAILNVLLPFIVIICSYLWLGLIARQQNRKICAMSNNETRTELQKKEWKGIKVAVTITSIFCLTWSISIAVVVIETFNIVTAPLELKLLAVMLPVVNPVCNSLIYFAMYKEFRQAAYRIVKSKLELLLCCNRSAV